MTDTSAGQSRREFLQSAAAGLVAAGLTPALGAAARADGGAAPAQIAMQLYTVRDAMKVDMRGTLRRVAGLGFAAVETAFWPEGVSLVQAAGALRDAGLGVCSCHVELPIGANRQVMLDTAKAFGATRMIWHGWPEDPRYGTLEGTKALAAIYNESNRIARDNGLSFGIHNHWWEFRNRVGGRAPFEVLVEELDPSIFFEVDTYWVKVAGQVPAAVVGRLGARAPLLHIKDGPARWNDQLAVDNPDPMTAVGAGTQDFPAIVRAANGHTEWLVVEMDTVAGDVFGALQASYGYLVQRGLGRGNRPG